MTKKIKSTTSSISTSSITTSLILLSVLVVLVLAGCGRMSGWTGSGEGNIDTYSLTGTEGLEIKFLSSMPPDKVLIGDKFNFGIRIENKGTYDLEEGEGKITINPDPSLFLVEQNKLTQTFGVQGRTQFLKEGETTQIYFPTIAKCFQQLKGQKKKCFTNSRGNSLL